MVAPDAPKGALPGDGDARSAQGRLADEGVPAVPAGDLAHDGEAHPESAGGAVAAAVEAHERLEQALPVLGRDATAVIVDVDHRAIRLRAHPHLDARARVLERVTDQ